MFLSPEIDMFFTEIANILFARTAEKNAWFYW